MTIRTNCGTYIVFKVMEGTVAIHTYHGEFSRMTYKGQLSGLFKKSYQDFLTIWMLRRCQAHLGINCVVSLQRKLRHGGANISRRLGISWQERWPCLRVSAAWFFAKQSRSWVGWRPRCGFLCSPTAGTCAMSCCWFLTTINASVLVGQQFVVKLTLAEQRFRLLFVMAYSLRSFMPVISFPFAKELPACQWKQALFSLIHIEIMRNRLQWKHFAATKLLVVAAPFYLFSVKFHLPS